MRKENNFFPTSVFWLFKPNVEQRFLPEGAKPKSSAWNPNTSGLAAVSETIVINYAYADEVLWNWAPKL